MNNNTLSLTTLSALPAQHPKNPARPTIADELLSMRTVTSLLGRALVRPRATPVGESIGASQGVYW